MGAHFNREAKSYRRKKKREPTTGKGGGSVAVTVMGSRRGESDKTHKHTHTCKRALINKRRWSLSLVAGTSCLLTVRRRGEGNMVAIWRHVFTQRHMYVYM